jgi:hypothetical protein
MDYPAGVREIVEQAEYNEAPPEVIDVIKDLPDKTYYNAADVSQGLKGERGNVYADETYNVRERRGKPRDRDEERTRGTSGASRGQEGGRGGQGSRQAEGEENLEDTDEGDMDYTKNADIEDIGGGDRRR